MISKITIKFKIATNKKWIIIYKRILYCLYILNHSVHNVQKVQNRVFKSKFDVDNQLKNC